MTIVDYILMLVVLAFASYLFYRSFFKKKGGCSSCEVSGNCEIKSLMNEQTDGKEADCHSSVFSKFASDKN
jgi:hypothetical protein